MVREFLHYSTITKNLVGVMQQCCISMNLSVLENIVCPSNKMSSILIDVFYF